MGQSEFKPVADKDRQLNQYDLALIWFGAAIAITEIWAGGMPSLTTLGLGVGLVAIVLGRLIGNGLMGAMARIGASTGLPGMVLTRPAFGLRGSYLPAILNILQLIGWTGWMLLVGFYYLDILAGSLSLPTAETQPGMRYLWVILLGALCTLWAVGGHRFWKVAQRISSILLFLLTVALTVIVFRHYDPASLFSFTLPTSGGFLAGTDLVVAMSISWLPLVADYSRYARKPRHGSLGTFWGYFIGGTWMYAVGLLVALATGTDAPDQMVIQVMGAEGAAWALMAIVLVLVSTVTTTFLDIFSTAVSTKNLWPGLPETQGNYIIGALGILVACFLETSQYEPFLLAIGAIFLPAFTIVLTDYFVIHGRKLRIAAVGETRGPYWYSRGFNPRALLAWVAGFIVFDWARGFVTINYFAGLAGQQFEVPAWPTGSSLPCIVATTVVYWILVQIMGTGVRAK